MDNAAAEEEEVTCLEVEGMTCLEVEQVNSLNDVLAVLIILAIAIGCMLYANQRFTPFVFQLQLFFQPLEVTVL